MADLVLFEEKKVRRVWNEEDGKWYFAIVDVVGILSESVDPAAYWRKLKERLKKEGNETVTNCHAFKMTAADGKQRMTDLELIFTMLGEASTTEIARKKDTQGFLPNKRVAREGGTVAGNARRDLEKRSGRKVSTRDNFLEEPERRRRLTDKRPQRRK